MSRPRSLIFAMIVLAALAGWSCRMPWATSEPASGGAALAPSGPTAESGDERIARLVLQLNTEQLSPVANSTATPLYPGEYQHPLCPAADQLVTIGRRAAPQLATAMEKNPDPIIRRNAAMTLARMGDASGVEVLYETVEDESLPVGSRKRRSADDPPLPGDVAMATAVRAETVDLLAALASGRDDSRPTPLDFPRLVAVYDRPSTATDAGRKLQVAIIRAAARSPSPEARELIVANLEVRDAALRWAALEAAAGGGVANLPEAAVRALSDPNARVAMAAMNALAAVRDPRLAAAFERLLENNDPTVRQEAVRLIGRTSPANASSLLVKATKDAALPVEREAIASAAELKLAEPIEAALDHPRWPVRLAAVEALGEMKSARSLPLLAGRTADSSINVRKALAEAVAEIGDGRGAAILVELMGDSAVSVRLAARDAWGKLPAAPALGDYDPMQPAWRNKDALARLKSWADGQATGTPSPTPGTDNGATTGTETRPKPGTIEAEIATLIDGLALPAGKDREMAVASLVRLKDQARPQLDAALANRPEVAAVILAEVLPAIDPSYAALWRIRDPDVTRRRQAAIQFVNGTKDQALAPVVKDKLRAALADETDPVVRRLVMDRLVEAGDERVADALVAGLRLDDPRARQASALALGRLKSKRAVGDLIAALRDERTNVQYAAAWALGEIGDRSAVGPLEKALVAREVPGRLAFASALAKLGAESGRDGLVRLLSDTTVNTQIEVAEAMAETPNEAYVAPLVAKLDASNERLTAAVNAALVKITGQDFGYDIRSTAQAKQQALAAWRNWYATAFQVRTPGK